MTLRRSAFLLLLAAFSLVPPAISRPMRRVSLVSCQAQGTQTFDQVFRYVQGFPEPKMHQDLGTAGIERLSGFAPSRFWQNPGLTIGSHELQTSYLITGVTRPGHGGVCVWLQSLDLAFRYTDLDVYVSNDYDPGSCEGKVIRAHEMLHVAVHRRLYGKYKVQLGRAIRNLQLPSASHPRHYASLAAAKAAIGKSIKAASEGVYNRFKRELTVENGKLDTPENYRKTQAQCGHWK